MRVALNQNWETIDAHLAWNADPLAILSVVNYVELRSWTFSLSFDHRARTVLRIQPATPMTRAELDVVMGGMIPEMFCADMVCLDSGGSAICADLIAARRLGGESELVFDSEPGLSFDAISLIGYFGEVIPPSMQSAADVRDRLREATRWGSSRPFHPPVPRVRWSVMGREFEEKPKSRLESVADSNAAFTQYRNLLNSGASAQFLADPGLSCTAFYHSDSGLLHDVSMPIGLTTRLSWAIEIDDPRLEYDALGHVGPKATLDSLVQDAAEKVVDIESSLAFSEYEQRLRRKGREEAATRLVKRQEAAKVSNYVFWADRKLARVPTCESELVALYMKLEALNALPFANIAVLEYTARRGIDALADFRLRANEHMKVLQPVEFEFAFESFFTHDHPEEQVTLVICWTLESEELVQGATVLRKLSPCLYEARIGMFSYLVLRIDRLPNLTIV